MTATILWTFLVTTLGPLLGTLVGGLGNSLLVQRKQDRAWIAKQYGICFNRRRDVKFEQWQVFRQKVRMTYSPEVYDFIDKASSFQSETEKMLLAYSQGFNILKTLRLKELKEANQVPTG